MTPLHVDMRGDGPDLVLLHGWALNGAAWGPWVDQLATRFRLHLLDLPGHGRSPWPDTPLDLAGLAGRVAAAVPPRAAVLGWSLGGLVALELLRTRAIAPHALVLIASTPRFLRDEHWPCGMDPTVLEGFAAGLARDHRRTVSNFLALQTWGDERATQTLRELRAGSRLLPEPDPRALAGGLEILRSADLREALPGIEVPALVVAGEYDRITTPEAGRELASRLVAARYREVAKAGHAPFLSHADEVAGTVLDFLDVHLPGRTTPQSSVARRRTAPAPTARSTPGPSAGEYLAEGAYALDRQRVRASFSRAASNYDEAAALQARVRGELLERLDLLRLRPKSVLDLGAGTGHGAAALKRRYGGARVLALDLAAGMLVQAGRRTRLWRHFDRIAADAAALPVRDGAVEMVFSSLMLQWCDDPDRVLRECRRVLAPGGVLHLATLGPDTLVELRRAWHAADPAHAHVSQFADMHDLGEALVRAGFSEPVLDVERTTLSYLDARELMRDLKRIGAHNAAAGRNRGLTGKRTLARMLDAYEDFRRDGRLPATYEVVYAQAWAAEAPAHPRRPVNEIVVPLGALRRRRS